MSSAIRRRLAPSSLRARLTFWYILTLGVTVGVFAIFVFTVRAGSLYRELDAELEIEAHQLATDLRPMLLALDVARSLAADPRAVQAPLLIREQATTVLFRSPRFPLLPATMERQLATAAREATRRLTVRDREGTATRVVTIVLDRPGAPSLVLQLAASTAGVQQILRELAVTMVVALVLVVTVASYGSGLTARRALAPVDQIVERVRRIQANRLSGRLDVRADSAEIDRLVQMLNEMLDRIEVSVRSARRFAADASHELQTPIAAMRSALEVCLRNPRTVHDYRGMAGDLLTEVDRLSALVRDLRLLALAEAGQMLEKPQRVDLGTLAAECCDICRALSERKQITVEARLAADAVIVGSALHLRRLILNLAQNAIRYSPASSTIVMSVGLVDGHVVLAVQDEGCGIDAEDVPHIFEPFYRTDRARDRETGGTGLGLAIADQIVRAHRGHIEVRSSVGRGSTFTVYLPRA